MSMPIISDLFSFDYQRHVAAQDLLPAHIEDFQRLVKLLRHAPSFQIFFAPVISIAYRDTLIGKIGELLLAANRPMCTFDLSDHSRFPDFAAFENELNAADHHQTTIHLINCDAWLDASNLVTLNLRRNALAEQLSGVLLWWLSPNAIARVAEHAPDVWSWRSGVFDFAEQSPSVEDVATFPGNPPLLSALTLPQRSQRLAVLNQQLAQEMPDEFRFDLLIEQADLFTSLGQWQDAEVVLRQDALPLATKLGDARSRAITQGRIADILQRRGGIKETLRIRRDEVLPTLEMLGDVREKAFNLAKIAELLQLQGEPDKALNILRIEVLPIFEKLGDGRSCVITQDRIADILQNQGKRDAALRLHRECLLIFEKLNDLTGIATTQAKIANIIQQQGEPDAALQILRTKVLPINQKLGDIRSSAITQNYIANILSKQGKLDEALNILRKDVLPITEGLGDMRTHAHTQGMIANILQRKGELDAALSILRGDVLPVFEKLSDIRSCAVSQSKIANILSKQGELDEALSTLHEDVLPSLEKLGDARSILVVKANLAQILNDRNHDNDRSEAHALLESALQDARRLNYLAEAERIKNILNKHRA